VYVSCEHFTVPVAEVRAGPFVERRISPTAAAQALHRDTTCAYLVGSRQ
jgi:hypothetical protein